MFFEIYVIKHNVYMRVSALLPWPYLCTDFETKGTSVINLAVSKTPKGTMNSYDPAITKKYYKTFKFQNRNFFLFEIF